MKLLVVCSSLDLKAPFSATPAWWQLCKGLYEVGASLAVTAYHGRVPETLWWRAYPNPARIEGELYAAAQNVVSLSRSPGMISNIAHKAISRRWKRHVAKIMKAEPDIQAALFISVPPNHLRGLATFIRQNYKIPVLFYDGDVPASLPDHQGFATGFRIYQGADIAEFDGVLSNSKGGTDAIRAMGARDVHVLYYAADPQIYQRFVVPEDIDISFYGTTAEYREDWLQAMITEPAQKMTDVRFVVRGRLLGDLGRVDVKPFFPFSSLREFISRSKINLVITRRPHASTYGSSSMRPFELAMMGACMVCNPCDGIEEWFEPGRELIVVHSAEEAMDRYRFLLTHEQERRAIGKAAHKRALAEHTYQHRVRQIMDIVNQYL